MGSFCKECDRKLEPAERTRCSECWRLKRIKWRKNSSNYNGYFFERNFRKPNSQERPHRNAVYVRAHNSLEHELEKTRVVWEHANEGHYCVTEAETTDKIIHDVYCDTCGAIEIVKTHLSDKVDKKNTTIRRIK